MSRLLEFVSLLMGGRKGGVQAKKWLKHGTKSRSQNLTELFGQNTKQLLAFLSAFEVQGDGEGAAQDFVQHGALF